MSDYIIIGSGVAGITAAENIRKLDETGGITIITDEDLPFYNRTRLNDYISGEIDEKALLARKSNWYTDKGINLMIKTRVTGAIPEEKTLITKDNNKLRFDSLLIATGSHSFIPPINGSTQEGVFSLRNILDARRIISYTKDAEKAVIIGGGLLGLESGNALLKLGKKITVIEFFPRLLPRQLDEVGGKNASNHYGRYGILLQARRKDGRDGRGWKFK